MPVIPSGGAKRRSRGISNRPDRERLGRDAPRFLPSSLTLLRAGFSLRSLGMTIALGMTCALPLAAQAPTQDYLVFVASEGNDRISLVRFGPNGAKVERVSKIGRNPTEPVGPHGIAVAPDKRYYYVSTAHGFPNGELWK